MAAGKRWTRDELLILLNLYVKLPFGSFDQSQPVIQDVAARMELTPGSVAMKLCNLAGDMSPHPRRCHATALQVTSHQI